MKSLVVSLSALALALLAPAHASESCTDIAAVGADYCYEVEGATAENCGNYFKIVTTSTWRYCKWDESRSKCRSKGGLKVYVEPACIDDEPPASPSPPMTPPPPSMPPTSPTACMYAIAQGDWCQGVTDMAVCPLSYAQFQYQGEMRYKGCAVRSGKCKGKGTAFGSTMPETCGNLCDAALDTAEAAMTVCSEGGECDFSLFSSLTPVCDTDQLQAVAGAFKNYLAGI